MANKIISTNDLILDNNIKPIDNYYASDNGIVRSEFHETDNRVVFEKNGRKFSWTPQEIKYVDEFGMEDVIYTVQNAPLEVKNNFARFNRAFPDIDDWFIQTNTELKHNILIQGFQRDPLPFLFGNIDFCVGGKIEYDSDLKIFADGEEKSGDFETNEQIWFVDSDNEMIFNLPQIVVYDSNIPERATVTGKYRVHKNENGVLSFQFVVDNAWISSPDRVFPLTVDPTVVANTAYDTSGNGGRKLVQLSNGWLIASTYEATNKIVRLYKSSDSGSTWVQLCYIEITTGGGAYLDNNHALVSNGNKIHILTSATGVALNIFNIDATLATNVNLWTSPGTYPWETTSAPDQNQTAMGSVSLAIDSTGNLHAAWASKNSSYPNSFNIRYSKSTDGGATWASPTQITAYNNSTYNHTQPSIVVKNDNNPVITWINAYGSPINYMVYGTRWTGSNWSSPFVVYDGGTYTQSSPCAVVDSNGVIHVVWHGRVASDEGQDFVFYSKSNDGGASWSAKTFLTTDNPHGRRPSIVVDKNNKLYVFFEYGFDDSASSMNIAMKTNDGSGWSAITQNTNYSGFQANALYPSAMASNTLIGWIYKDEVANAVQFDKILLNQAPSTPTITSPNGNETWDATHTITWSPASDVNGDGLQYNIELSTDNGSTWKTIVALTSVGTTSYSYNFSNELESSTSLIRIRAWDGYVYGNWDYSNAVFTISHNQAPSAPTNLTPSGGASINRALTQRLSWQHNDTGSQSKFDLQWSSDNGATWTTVTQVSSSQYWDAAGNTFPSGTIVWKVRTYDQENLVSPYSTQQSFVAGDKPVKPTITSPTNNSTITGSQITVQWSSSEQTSYQIQVVNSSNATVHDTGEVISANKARTLDFVFLNNSTYTIKVRVKNVSGLWSDYSLCIVNISYTPPKIPSILLSKNFNAATIIVTIINPTPSGGTPTVAKNEIYRRLMGSIDWVKIGETVTDTYVDYQCPHGYYEYSTIAVGSNGANSSRSTTQSIESTFDGWWIVDKETNQTFQFLYNIPNLEVSLEEERQEIRTFSPKPFIRYGNFSAEKGTLSGLNITDENINARQTSLLFQQMIKQRKPFYLKNDIGDAWTINLFNFRRNIDRTFNTEEISIEWVEV